MIVPSSQRVECPTVATSICCEILTRAMSGQHKCGLPILTCAWEARCGSASCYADSWKAAVMRAIPMPQTSQAPSLECSMASIPAWWWVGAMPAAPLHQAIPPGCQPPLETARVIPSPRAALPTHARPRVLQTARSPQCSDGASGARYDPAGDTWGPAAAAGRAVYPASCAAAGVGARYVARDPEPKRMDAVPRAS